VQSRFQDAGLVLDLQAHLVSLEQDDWQRLYRFTLDVHRRRLNTHPRAIRDYLVNHGCSRQKASWVSGHNLRFAELLGFYDRQRGSAS